MLFHREKGRHLNVSPYLLKAVMKVLPSVLVTLFLSFPIYAAGNAPADSKVVGEQAEDIISHGTVTDIFSKDSTYGVKYFYTVLHYGYKWLCEQATYRMSCYLRK